MTRKQTSKSICILSVLTVCILSALAVSFSSCNVTRTVTTKSEYWQKGDTAVTIQTRTVEQYDASKKL
ncbi:MAG: hypothetical protein J5761_02140 [Paludibacteraceae bacterium]|nr:hypothetical protein [Paludibacteraceae bacterium]